jgi:hypothetical protein
VSEIFGTAAAGNSVAFSQNPTDFRKGEYSFSGIDYPHQVSVLLTEQLPFFKEQHGLFGHLFGGWAISANYIAASGQRYTPSQIATAEFSSPGDFFDQAFLNAFAGTDSARPFFGNRNAPVTNVGAFGADACVFFAITGTEPVCSPAFANTLVSVNSLNVNGPNSTPVTVTSNDVRYILNGGGSQAVFGTPFGNVRRNLEQDAITSIGNLSVFKSLKFSERVAFEFHATSLNVLNHPNFLSIDPFLEDAGLTSPGTGFGDPTVTNSQPRKLLFGGRISF